MTNKEKYKEIFGVDPDTSLCPTTDCGYCPLYNPDRDRSCRSEYRESWWNSEYKEKTKTTNEEKYLEVFGFYPDYHSNDENDEDWWDEDYEGEQ